MSYDVRNQLKESTSQINFNELKIDILRDVIILLSPELDLMDVAEACALDNKELFEKLIKEGKINKPDISELEKLKNENSKYYCSIVKPFLFLQKDFQN